MNGAAFGAGKVAASLIAKYGSMANCFRKGTEQEADDGSDITPWLATQNGQGVKVFIEPLTVAAAQRIFGLETDVRFRGFVKTGVPIDFREKNAIVITRGNYKSMKFRVVEAPPWPIAGLIQLGLVETKESIG